MELQTIINNLISIKQSGSFNINQEFKLVSAIKNLTDLEKSQKKRYRNMRQYSFGIRSARLRYVIKQTRATLSSISQAYCVDRPNLSKTIQGKINSQRCVFALESAWKLKIDRIRKIYAEDILNEPTEADKQDFIQEYGRILNP